jgi:hypothetical protein
VGGAGGGPAVLDAVAVAGEHLADLLGAAAAGGHRPPDLLGRRLLAPAAPDEAGLGAQGLTGCGDGRLDGGVGRGSLGVGWTAGSNGVGPGSAAIGSIVNGWVAKVSPAWKACSVSP